MVKTGGYLLKLQLDWVWELGRDVFCGLWPQFHGLGHSVHSKLTHHWVRVSVDHLQRRNRHCYIQTYFTIFFRKCWLSIMLTLFWFWGTTMQFCVCLIWYFISFDILFIWFFCCFNKIATYRINSRWQVDKEALWLIEGPTYLSKCTPPFLGICQFYF